MKRRDFLKCLGVVGAGLIGSRLASGAEPASGPAVPSSMNAAVDLAIARGKDPAAITRAAIDTLGGIGRFVARGDVVMVKPNIGWDRTPEQAANTNPVVVATLVKLCFDAGASKVRVLDRTCNDARRTYVQSGIEAAAGAVGAEVVHFDERRCKDVMIKGRALSSWSLLSDLFEVDKVINVPIAKHHRLAQLTMALKNWMGMMGGNRSRIHQNLDQSLADLALVIKPMLTVLDAVRILTANGPTGGNLADVKQIDTVVAGVDQVAIDAYGATLFGMKGEDLGYVKLAAEMGVGQADLTRVTIREVTV